MTAERIYLIDGVQVTKRVWERRKIWGEHPSADFRIVELKRQEQAGGRKW